MAETPEGNATLITRRDHDKTWSRPTDERHVFRLRGFVVNWIEVEDVLFHHDSAVMMPDDIQPDALDGTAGQNKASGLGAAATCLRHAETHPDEKLLVAGHTDRSGSDSYNVTLSELRADNVLAVLLGDKGNWVEVSQGKHKVEDYQQILTWVAHWQGWACDPGGIDNVHGQQTTDAIRAFQDQYSKASFGEPISVDGAMGPQTWGAFFRMYMKRLAEILETEEANVPTLRSSLHWLNDGQKRVGCGEFHPIDAPNKDGYRSQVNRRVELLFFDPGEEPKMDCHAGTCQPDKCELYDGKTYEFRYIETKPAPIPLQNLKWVPDKAVCGDEVKLTGETTAADGTPVTVKLTRQGGSGPALEDLSGSVAGGKVEIPWKVKNVGFEEGGSFKDSVDVQAEATAGSSTGSATLKVKALLDAAKQTFSATRNWSGFTMKPHFDQRIEKFENKVDVSFDVIKAWGGYYIDLRTAGVTGTAGGCPWAGYRWGRATGANAMAPNQYYDGSNWVALPTGFVLTGLNHSAIGFYKSGSNFVSTSGGTWPEAFADYDFNSTAYTKRRADWIKDTHDTWTNAFHIRRKECKSETKLRCCRYGLDVTLAFNQVTAYASGVIALCPGALRSNASIWFMDEPRIKVAAHESGHHMDNPDEYAGGAVDPTLNGDGAVNGIDADSIMGQNLTKVKKRHFHAFVEMNKKLIKTAYGKEYDYEAVEK